MKSSNKQPKTSIAVITAYRSERSDDENAMANLALQTTLNFDGYRAKPCDGHFNGKDEKGFIIGLDQNLESFALKRLDAIAQQYGQDSFLYVNAEREGFLRFNDLTIEKLGKFIAVSKFEAKAGNYTYDPLTSTYFVIK